MSRRGGGDITAEAGAPARRFFIDGHEHKAAPLEPALYLVATPIGNLADITLRALQVLAAADIIACEDTRVTRTLLTRYGIERRTVAYHEHNAAETGPRLLDALGEGRSVALVSDAGTPLVSDPGYRLAREAVGAGLKVVPLPGPSAPLAALVASGLPTDTFLFAGFLPAKRKGRRERLAELATTPATLVLFESPRRLPQALADAAEVLGAERPAVVARELTKLFEELRRAPLGELAAHYAEAGPPRGEVVICIGPPAAQAATPAGEDIDLLLGTLLQTMPPAKAAREAAKRTGLARDELYQRLLALKRG